VHAQTAPITQSREQKIAQALCMYARIVWSIRRHIGAGIPKDGAERLGLPQEDYLPETAEEMIVAHADNLMDDAGRINIDERILRWEAGI